MKMRQFQSLVFVAALAALPGTVWAQAVAPAAGASRIGPDDIAPAMPQTGAPIFDMPQSSSASKVMINCVAPGAALDGAIT